MKKLSDEELKERYDSIQSLYKQQTIIIEFLKENNIPKYWFISLKNYCKICNHSTECEQCFNKKRKNHVKRNNGRNGKTAQETVLERELKLKQKEDNRMCRICGTKENLQTYNSHGRIFKKNICKTCFSKKRSETSIKMWDSFTKEKRENIICNIHKTRNETLEDMSSEERKILFGSSLREYRKNETEEQYNFRIDKQRQSLNNRTSLQKEETAKKVSEAWKNKSQEEIDKRSEKIFNTKIEKGTFNNFQVFGYDKKAQDLFWFLHDNTIFKNIKYATINTRDIDNPQNNELKIRVKDISKTNIFRNLDFYIQLKNNFEVNIEFDPKSSHKDIEKDLMREEEILLKKPNMLILRIKEDEYLQNKDKVKNEILSIIKEVESYDVLSYDKIPRNYLPLHITNKLKEIENN